MIPTHKRGTAFIECISTTDSISRKVWLTMLFEIIYSNVILKQNTTGIDQVLPEGHKAEYRTNYKAIWKMWYDTNKATQTTLCVISLYYVTWKIKQGLYPVLSFSAFSAVVLTRCDLQSLPGRLLAFSSTESRSRFRHNFYRVSTLTEENI